MSNITLHLIFGLSPNYINTSFLCTALKETLKWMIHVQWRLADFTKLYQLYNLLFALNTTTNGMYSSNLTPSNLTHWTLCTHRINFPGFTKSIKISITIQRKLLGLFLFLVLYTCLFRHCSRYNLLLIIIMYWNNGV